MFHSICTGITNIIVFGEIDGDSPTQTTAQLMNIGKTLGAELKRDVNLLFIGGEELTAAEKGYGFGADKVIMVSDPQLAHYMSDSYLQVMTQIVQDLNPSIILLAHNEKGLDLASRLAFRLKTGVTLDCVELKIDSATGSVLSTKPVFGGKAHVHYQFMGKWMGN